MNRSPNTQAVQQPVAVPGDFVMAGEVVEAQERAVIVQQMDWAHEHPRQISRVKQMIYELATIDQATAADCFYRLPSRGGKKPIEGPRIRLAEIVVASYGNLKAATRVVEIGATHVTCQGVCIDLERNTAVMKDVRRRITGKDGKRYSDDMITMTAMAAQSIALRNAVFAIVPLALFGDEIAQIRAVARGADVPFGERVTACFAHFAGLGVAEDRVLAVVNCRGRADMTEESLDELRGLTGAISEGITTVADAFPEPTKEKATPQPGRRKTAPKVEPALEAEAKQEGPPAVDGFKGMAEDDAPQDTAATATPEGEPIEDMSIGALDGKDEG